jgi:hypothetical protein
LAVNGKQALEKYKYWLLAGLLLAVLMVALPSLYRYGVGPIGQAEGAAEQYAELKKEPDTKGGNWLRTLNGDIQAVQGDLLWNSAQQTGMMRLVNLPNPKTGYQYHVWAYDSHKPAEQAISVSVLDRGSAQQEWYVPLTANEELPSPYKFELTLEPINSQTNSQAVVLLMVQF